MIQKKYGNHRIKYPALAALMSLLAWQCTERIEVGVDSTYARLVVEGAVSTDTTIHSVMLSLTSDYFYNQAAPVVSGATVSIYDGAELVTLAEDPDRPGIYETEPGYYGIPGREYTLMISDVDVDRDGVHEDYTASSVLQPVNDLDSIYVQRFESFFSGYQVLLYAWDPPEERNYYAFKVYRNGKLLTDTLNELIVEEDLLFNGNYTNGIACQFLSDEKPDEKARVGDTVTFEINGITREYYQYVLEAQSETFMQTPLFSGPPANISTNLSNGALGFFVAYSVKRSSAIVRE